MLSVAIMAVAPLGPALATGGITTHGGTGKVKAQADFR